MTLQSQESTSKGRQVVRRSNRCINDDIDWGERRAMVQCCHNKLWLEGADLEPSGGACKECVEGKCPKAYDVSGYKKL